MSKDMADIERIALQISKHHEKTGTVLVGMHQELQEQKVRLKEHELTVATVVANTGSEVSSLISKAIADLERALAPFADVEAVATRAGRSLADLKDLADRLGSQINKQAESLVALHKRITSDTREAIAEEVKPVLSRISDESGRFTKTLDDVASQASQSLDALSGAANRLESDVNDHADALDNLHGQFIIDTRTALAGEVERVLSRLDSESSSFARSLEESINDLGAKYRDVMKSVLKVHVEAVADEVKSIRALNAELRSEVLAHQTRVSDFARRSRNAVILSVSVWAIVLGSIYYLSHL
jgi:hypothetical protein